MKLETKEYSDGTMAIGKYPLPELSPAQQDEKFAISVNDECANVYYNSYYNLPNAIKKKLSFHMLREIFKGMVIPAIEKARELDRN